MRSRRRTLADALVALSLALAPAAASAVTVTSIASGSEGPFISGLAVENFEDVTLLNGLSVTFSVWRTSGNLITADPPVVYNGTLPATWTCSVDGFPNNPWDGTRALVNGRNHDWAYPFASNIKLAFVPARDSVGLGLSNFQRDAGSQFTFHSLYVNDVFVTKLESLTGWATNIFGHNRYLFIEGDPGEPIASITIVADTHFDGMVIDKLAMDAAVPTAGTTWGRLKRLYH